VTTPLPGVAWDDLAVLLAATEHRSLNRAARALGIGQSTASRRLARLEGELGARLFDRTPDGLRPTALAGELLPHARLIEGHMADITRLAEGREAAPEGRVRLAVPDGFASAWLIPRLPGFFARWPAVELDLSMDHAVADLVRREADLALRFVRPRAPDLVFQRVGHLAMGAFARPELAACPPGELRWIHLHDPELRFTETRWLRTQVRPERTMGVSQWQAMFTAACTGLGAAVLSPVVAEPAGLVSVLGDRPPPPGRDLFLVVHRALRHVPRIRVVFEWLRGQLDTGAPGAAAPSSPTQDSGAARG
jgi:DNA-binding transcriptional LysR family regulator